MKLFILILFFSIFDFKHKNYLKKNKSPKENQKKKEDLTEGETAAFQILDDIVGKKALDCVSETKCHREILELYSILIDNEDYVPFLKNYEKHLDFIYPLKYNGNNNPVTSNAAIISIHFFHYFSISLDELKNKIEILKENVEKESKKTVETSEFGIEELQNLKMLKRIHDLRKKILERKQDINNDLLNRIKKEIENLKIHEINEKNRNLITKKKERKNK